MKEKNIYVKNSIYANVTIQTALGRTKLVQGKPQPEPLFVDSETITIKIEEDDKDKAIEIIKQKLKEASKAINS
tara:strand:- start:248 stop:469 length:222 start_codon:yes stop_codon:yes gene_type:complete